jgi:site-specific DNA-methyltransferase (adenine-specific)
MARTGAARPKTSSRKAPRIRLVPLSELVLHDENANKGTARGRALLSKSLASYGAGRSVLVDKHNRVIAGNKTVEQARAAGMKSIAVIEADGSMLVAVRRGDLDLKKDAGAKELAIADNRVAELDLEWDPEVLASLDINLKQFWNELELASTLGDFAPEAYAPPAKIDQADELLKKWRTERGQIWQIGPHRLMCGDSTDEASVEALVGRAELGSIITDPPYEAEAHTLQRRSKFGGSNMRGVLKVEPLEFPPVSPEMRKAVAHQARRASRWVLIFCQIEASQEWRHSCEEEGLTYRRSCLWIKPDGMPQYSGDRPGMGYETFVAMHKPGKSSWNGGGRHGVFTFYKNESQDGRTKNPHPTQKPVALIRELFNLFTEKDETVLDLFVGSGTMMVSAALTERVCFGMELEPKYCAVALERLADMGLKPELGK